MKSITLITTAIVLTGSILAAAQAAPPSDVPTAVIKFQDLDIAGPAGKEKLYGRLVRAARAVCSPLDPNGSVVKPAFPQQYETCIDQAVSGAVARFNRQEFSDYVTARQSNGANASLRLAGR
jgi:UrcA family protein